MIKTVIIASPWYYLSMLRDLAQIGYSLLLLLDKFLLARCEVFFDHRTIIHLA